MRAALERFAWRIWRGEAGLVGGTVRALLLPFEGLWRLATRVRNRRHERASAAGVEGLRVVSVGNLAVGGTGKTPVAAWVVARLGAMGARPALLLRGYGDDEVALHRTWNPGVPVEVAADRREAALRARAAGADAAVLDDGFQHRAMGRILDIVLLAAEDPLPGALLPRGPYREPLSALHRADVVILTRKSASVEEARACLRTLEDTGVMPEGVTTAGLRLATDSVGALSQDEAEASEEIGPRVLALTAIARPHLFQRDVAALTGATVDLLAFPDHHAFTADDAREARIRAGEAPIYVTEKDAVKLVDHAAVLGDARVVRQRLEWDWGADDVLRRLEAVFGFREEEDS